MSEPSRFVVTWIVPPTSAARSRIDDRPTPVTEPFHKAVDGPHWYLLAVGARSECQGQGLGSALVEVGTSRADAAGVPCYLETGTQSNIDFYTKRGFEIVGQTGFDGHTLTGMVRQPRELSTP